VGQICGGRDFVQCLIRNNHTGSASPAPEKSGRNRWLTTNNSIRPRHARFLKLDRAASFLRAPAQASAARGKIMAGRPRRETSRGVSCLIATGDAYHFAGPHARATAGMALQMPGLAAAGSQITLCFSKIVSSVNPTRLHRVPCPRRMVFRRAMPQIDFVICQCRSLKK